MLAAISFNTVSEIDQSQTTLWDAFFRFEWLRKVSTPLHFKSYITIKKEDGIK